MIPPIVFTEDGSITCFDAETSELYHNRAGAFTEAFKNYVEPSNLADLIARQSDLYLLDVCFGLGYNTFVLIQEILKILDSKPFSLQVIAIDKDPTILKAIPMVLQNDKFQYLSQFLDTDQINGPGNYHFRLKENLSFQLNILSIELRQEINRLAKDKLYSFDLIFHDGFSPYKMPELWTIDLFQCYVKLLKPKGKILTYSSAAAVRGALLTCGLKVKRTTAVGGKSGGTIAYLDDSIKLASGIEDLSEAERLKLESAIPYRDPSLSNSREEILQRRENERAISSN